MSRKKTLIAGALVVLIAILGTVWFLVGKNNEETLVIFPEASEFSVTDSTTTPPNAGDPGPLVMLNERSVEVILYGSSSCVPTIDSVEVDGTTVNLNLADPSSKMCTMDYAPVAYTVQFPETITEAPTDFTYATCTSGRCQELPVFELQ